ncbi:MAG: response regulator transcription factor [Bacillota bacterium]|nr:response regulator transcription factor [Bacillota bacterium]
MVRVLVVEDEEGIREVLRQYLTAEGHTVLEAPDGTSGLALIRLGNPEFVILDLMLPGIDGFTLCGELRRLRPEVPVIMLTARDHETDKIAGLRLGADDYVTKPFSPRELMARIAAVARRSRRPAATVGDDAKRPAAAESPPADGLWVDLADRRAFYFGQELSLTRSELALISTLGARAMRTYTRPELLERLRGDDAEVTERAVDVHIANLRKKLDEAAAAAGFGAGNPIETVWGLGYRWREEVASRVRASG